MSGISTFDASSVTSSNFASVFSSLEFDVSISQKVLDLSTSAAFSGLTLVVNLLSIFVEQGQTLEQINEFKAGLSLYIKDSNFYAKDTVKPSILKFKYDTYLILKTIYIKYNRFSNQIIQISEY